MDQLVNYEITNYFINYSPSIMHLTVACALGERVLGPSTFQNLVSHRPYTKKKDEHTISQDKASRNQIKASLLEHGPYETGSK